MIFLRDSVNFVCFAESARISSLRGNLSPKQSKNSPSLAEGVRGWVIFILDSAFFDFFH
ncbi:hypothetical protein [Helicobacter sp. 23-1045]